ncbi:MULTISPECIES: DUF3868 domain-containing protein [Proteiniphilum]|mgnify:CR=1 FL=1|uniref:DUF3868 domain-containing protein n=1 Tax=Proteiniphilum TaxID=294702 RepID=UPI001EEB5AF6|nr:MULTISPECIES: DUF3868 domain-containing protein [Proteiniphilum]ULB34001.1 DUF3868 domain-containing protein [Proteiniphilum propionicum]
MKNRSLPVSLFTFLISCMLPFQTKAQQNKGQLYIQEKEIIQKDNTLRIHLLIDAREIKVNSATALELIPELFDEELHTLALPKIVLNGRKRHRIEKRKQVFDVSHSSGQDVYTIIQPETDPAIIDYDVTTPYEGWMNASSLRVRQALCGCPGEREVLADNLLIENLLGEGKPDIAQREAPQEENVTLYLHFMEPGKEEKKARSEYGEAYLNFIVNKWDILYDYKDNAKKLNQVQDFFKRAQEDKDIVMDGISIIGYASPEGTYEHNMMLSQKRASSFANWIQSRFSFPYSLYSVEWYGEDWEKLIELVEKSYMPEKYQVVDIIRNIGVYEGRETRLMNLNGGRTYNYMLENMFPQLRRVYYRIDYTVRPFTVEEGKEIMKTKPQQMSVFELYSVANTYRRGSKEYNRAMQEAVEQFPQDPAAINNASAVALQEGRLGEAKALLDRTPESASRQNNLGVYYMLTGDWARAQAAFTKALNGGISDARHNLDIVARQLSLKKQREREETERKAIPYRIR